MMRVWVAIAAVPGFMVVVAASRREWAWCALFAGLALFAAAGAAMPPLAHPRHRSR